MSDIHHVVKFALSSTTVEIIGQHQVNDGDTIYHVRDIDTGHCDFVGSTFISTEK